jgi:hypothetical protein
MAYSRGASLTYEEQIKVLVTPRFQIQEVMASVAKAVRPGPQSYKQE